MTRFLNLSKYLLAILIILGALYNMAPISLTLAQGTVAEEQANRAKLEQELAKLEKELAEVTSQLNAQKGQSSSLKNDISVLTSKINQNKLDIRAKNVLIEKLGGEINDRNKTIYSLTEKIEREKESMAQLLKKSYELQDETSFVHVLMAEQTLSDFYRDLDDFQSIQESIHDSLAEIRGDKVEVEIEKTELIKKQDEQENAKARIEAAKLAVERNEKEKQTLLKISQGKESEYNKIKAEKERQKAQILAALFGLRDSAVQINFEQALAYSTEVSKATGVRPAFIMAILTQETNLGANQGSCYLTNPDTGAGVSKTGKVFSNVMKPSRDVAPFLDITSRLGRDYTKTLVSCPLGGGGWGGAMGPSQFIPSTWKAVESKIAAILGISTPNPWNPRDAFYASGIFLRDLGASAQTYTAERNAACRYYSGRACDSRAPANSFYGNSVMSLATKIQANIDIVQGN